MQSACLVRFNYMGANIVFDIEHMGFNFGSHSFEKTRAIVCLQAASLHGVNVANFIKRGGFSPCELNVYLLLG